MMHILHKTKITLLMFTMLLLVTAFPSQAIQSSSAYTTATRYNIHGQVTGVILPDPDGSGPLHYGATRNTYNSNRLLVTVEQGELQYWQNETVAPANWSGFSIISKTVYQYDNRGRRVSIAQKDNYNSTKTYSQTSYDQYDRVVCQVTRMNPANFNSLATDACTANYDSQYGYDRVTKYSYNTIGQVLVVYKAFDTPLQQAYQTNTYHSEKKGLLTSVKDANNNITRFEYDDNGRLEKRRYPNGTFNFYTYDGSSNITEERKRNGAIFKYRYDKLQRLTYKSYQVAGETESVSYSYDNRGLNTRVTKTKGSYSNNITVWNTFNGAGDLIATGASEGYYQYKYSKGLNFEYDLNGNRTATIFPDGKKFHYEFDYLNRVNRLKNNDNGELLRLSYNKDGARQSISRRSLANTNYTYDSINRLSSFSQNFTGSSYDLTNTFNYNPANQITNLQVSNSTYHYQGNNNKVGNYSVNSLNQYTNVAGKSLSYDTNGNLTSDGNKSYSYDNENRLTSSYPMSFTYDGLGRLFKTNNPGGTTYYLYDGDALVAEYNGNGQITARYIHGDRVDEPWIQFAGSSTSLANTRFLHADHQGSIIAYSDTYGNIKGTNSYDAYGIAKSTNTGRFGYTGQLYFKALDLNYYKARFYHPKLGRFLQTDPVFYEDQMNIYAYVGNDPVNMTDPSGMEMECVTDTGGNVKCTFIYTFKDFAIDFGLVVIDVLTGPTPDAAMAIPVRHAAAKAVAITAAKNAAKNGIKLTAGGKRKIGNLAKLKDTKASDAIKKRGGGQGQVNQLESGMGDMTVGEIANSAAKGNRAAETAMKIIKQAGSKAQKYGGK